MSALFSPIMLRRASLPNRIIVSPMCQYSAEDGLANKWHEVHLATLALSGAAMLCIESTAVEPEGRITPGDLGLWNDATEAALKTVLDTVRAHSNIFITLQLAHAGRKASSHKPWHNGHLIPPSEGGWKTFAPSAVPQKEGEAAPIELDLAGLERIRDAFVAAAKRAARLGLDGIELHGGHGYLLHQFMSPVSNQRTDEYGGSLQNRQRYPLEIFDAVRAVFPADKPVGIKVSASDWVEGGWDIEQTIALARELKKRDVDWIVASSGGISPLQNISPAPGYQVPFAAAIKKATGVNTTAVGLITEAGQADEIIKNGQADFVAIARAMLYDPRWGWHAAAELGATVDAPPQYWRAPPREHADVFGKIVQGAR